MSLRYYDAHNHLQDERLGGRHRDLIAACRRVGVVRMVVNGSCETDWPLVAALAREHPHLVLSSFGLHPWYVHQRTPDWQSTLLRCLERSPAAVGEIGLDRWRRDLVYDDQEGVFLWQLAIAAQRNLPVSIHCLRAWGRLFDLLRSNALPARGFLLHSYGGPKEMVIPLSRLGAFFSFPGAFAHERKSRQRDAFLLVPLDRLLVETDAPDQLLPEEITQYRLLDPTDSSPMNHPANLAAVYAFLAAMLRLPLPELTAQVESNFSRFFLAPSRS